MGEKEKKLTWSNAINKVKEYSRLTALNIFGTSEELRDLSRVQKVPRHLLNLAGLGAIAYSFFSEDLRRPVVSSDVLRIIGTLYFIMDSIYADHGFPTFAGSIRGRLIKNRRAKYIQRVVCQEYENLDIGGLKFGDQQLLFLKLGLPQEQMSNLTDLLRQVNNDSKDLPDIGVELSYSHKLPQDVISLLNNSTYIANTHIRESFASENKSEIRILPTNPYSFRWLMQEVGKYLPNATASVRLTVGDVNDKRIPYVFLALYFMNPACGFQIVEGENDEINFPGVYVGTKIDAKGNMVSRGQTSYYVMQSQDVQEIADAALFAAKLHSLNDGQFENFQKQLREFMGLQRWFLYLLLGQKWPNKESQTSPYTLPKIFTTGAVEQAKINLGLEGIEDRIRNPTDDDKDRLVSVISSMKELLEKTTLISPVDFSYRLPLEEAIKLYSTKKSVSP